MLDLVPIGLLVGVLAGGHSPALPPDEATADQPFIDFISAEAVVGAEMEQSIGAELCRLLQVGDRIRD